jgi:hypothetical protein
LPVTGYPAAIAVFRNEVRGTSAGAQPRLGLLSESLLPALQQPLAAVFTGQTQLPSIDNSIVKPILA